MNRLAAIRDTSKEKAIPNLSNNFSETSNSINCCYSLNSKEKSTLLEAMGGNKQEGFYVSLPTEYENQETKENIERLVPFSEAKVFRTSTGFVVRDSHDDDWCKFIPFDDLDRVQTKVAYQTLEPARIAAMESMPLPVMRAVPKEALDDFEKEFQKICKAEREQAQTQSTMAKAVIETMRIETLTTSDPSRLTREDLIEYEFGSLASFVDDYTQDVYEAEEKVVGNLPSLSQFSTASYPESSLYYAESTYESGPLSYQKTVLKENPLLSENFERPTKTESLVCNSSLVADFNNHHEDCLPSSTNLSPFEKELQFASKTEIKHEAPRLEGESENPDEPETYFTEWQLLKQSMPEGLFYNSILAVISLIMILLGTFIEANIMALFIIFSVTSHFFKAVLCGIRTTAFTFKEKYFEQATKRRAFSNRKNKLNNRAALNIMSSPHHLDNLGPSPPPLGCVVLNKPEGVAASNKKVKRTYHVKPAKISEARVIRLNDNRPYVITKFVNDISRYALLDSGATCSAIHPRFLLELQKHVYVPTKETKVSVEGCIPDVKQVGNQIAYLDFQLETGHCIKNVPFLVYEGNYDILIGSNLIKGYRWANCWKNQDCYINLGNNEPLVPIYYGDNLSFETTAASIAEVLIRPQETKLVRLSIPHVTKRQPSPFKDRDLLIESLFEIEESNDLIVIPTLSRVRREQVCVAVRNKSEMPMAIAEGQEIAKVSVAPSTAVVHHLNEIIEEKQTFNLIPRLQTTSCHCEQTKVLDPDETVVQILIADQWGHSSIGHIGNIDKP